MNTEQMMDQIQREGLPMDALEPFMLRVALTPDQARFVGLEGSEPDQLVLVPVDSVVDLLFGDIVDASILLNAIGSLHMINETDRNAIGHAIAILNTIGAVHVSREKFLEEYEESATQLKTELQMLADQWIQISEETGRTVRVSTEPYFKVAQDPVERFDAALLEYEKMDNELDLTAAERREELERIADLILDLPGERFTEAIERVADVMDFSVDRVAGRVKYEQMRRGMRADGQNGSQGTNQETGGGEEAGETGTGEPVNGAEPRG